MWLDQLLANPMAFSAFDHDTSLHDALAKFIERSQPSHLATATLFEHNSRLALEDALNDWAVRVNRCYMGRRWHGSDCKDKTLNAFVYIVRGMGCGEFHASLLVRPPHSADPLDFKTRAPTFFALDFLTTFPPLGDMVIEPIPFGEGADRTHQIALAFLAKLASF